MTEYSEFWKDTVLRSITRNKDQAIIPPDIGNVDYVEYLQWLDDGNIPDIYSLDFATMTKTLLSSRPGELPRPN